jgi:diguanylate cyclase (GGDEF)-like protein/PAS domain S-box-containing protein
LGGARLEGRTLYEVLPPEIVAVIEPHFRLALGGDESTFDLSLGGRIYLQRLAPLRNSNDEIVSCLGFTQDVTAERRSQRALRDSEEQFRGAFDYAPIGKALIGLDGRFLRANLALCELLGYSEAELKELTVADISLPYDRAETTTSMAKLLAGELTLYGIEKRYLQATGDAVWVSVSVSVVRDQDGSARNFIAQIQDISERKRQEQILSVERRRLRAAQAVGRIGSWELEVETGAVTWSDTLFELYGLDPEHFGGDYSSALAHVHPDDVEELHAALEACASTGVPLSSRHRAYRANDGEMRWFDARATRHQDGPVSRLAGVVVDVTEQVLAEARLKHAALHDQLTGLPNRRLVADRLGRALDRGEREGQVVVVFCDLDSFKWVNDVHGHHVGDAVLVETAARIVASTRTGDTVGRMGGDEFLAICGVARGGDPAVLGNLMALRIEQAMKAPIVVGGTEHRVTVSIGVCPADQGDTADVVVRNAEAAMYLAKSRGRNGHAMFDPSLQRDVIDRDSIETHLNSALADDTLEVHYQPIVEPGTGRVRAVEALLRVPDGAGSYLDAAQAVKVAEQMGIISEIGDRVLHMACAQVATWRTQPGHGDLELSVNRSAAEIDQPGMYDRITNVVFAAGLDPRALTIEITETVLLDAGAHTIVDLGRLRSDGIGIAIDDFGTGYASLHYLATLPITCLKVDRSFITGLPDDLTCVTILSATVGLAADLGMACVVEGVETLAQLNALPQGPNVLIQGYLYSQPQPAAHGLVTHFGPLSARSPSSTRPQTRSGSQLEGDHPTPITAVQHLLPTITSGKS